MADYKLELILPQELEEKNFFYRLSRENQILIRRALGPTGHFPQNRVILCYDWKGNGCPVGAKEEATVRYFDNFSPYIAITTLSKEEVMACKIFNPDSADATEAQKLEHRVLERAKQLRLNEVTPDHHADKELNILMEKYVEEFGFLHR